MSWLPSFIAALLETIPFFNSQFSLIYDDIIQSAFRNILTMNWQNNQFTIQSVLELNGYLFGDVQ